MPNQAAVLSAHLPEALVDVTLVIVHPFEMNLLSDTPPSENFYKIEERQFQNKSGCKTINVPSRYQLIVDSSLAEVLEKSMRWSAVNSHLHRFEKK